MQREINPPITVRPYDWAHVARLARDYGVHPQVMLDTILSQANYLPGAIGDGQMRRELRSQALASKTYAALDSQEMHEEHLLALGAAGESD